MWLTATGLPHSVYDSRIGPSSPPKERDAKTWAKYLRWLWNRMFPDDGSHHTACELEEIYDVYVLLSWRSTGINGPGKRLAAGFRGFDARNARPHDLLGANPGEAEEWRPATAEPSSIPEVGEAAANAPAYVNSVMSCSAIVANMK
jgi:hypothetical protein